MLLESVLLLRTVCSGANPFLPCSAVLFLRKSTILSENALSLQGERGKRGRNGFTGPPGSPGPQGNEGTPGNPGDKGSKGEAGLGRAGPRGPRGLPGPPGEEGIIGVRGPVGMMGPNGIAGLKGEKGDAGFPGPKGERALDVLAFGFGGKNRVVVLGGGSQHSESSVELLSVCARNGLCTLTDSLPLS
ncbi:collagen alpha-2(IX) chain-like [Sphaerodactylus townsendi]|uniref:collagen alpha-2(IX) chain-like n=1 Tax=Sphaerodactylus townsendi TaxID=933632 RepID=UPI0020276681|nr:collagen alpha-2(IX) chain-like [Sphaerodactylus townsendi]